MRRSAHQQYFYFWTQSLFRRIILQNLSDLKPFLFLKPFWFFHKFGYTYDGGIQQVYCQRIRRRISMNQIWRRFRSLKALCVFSIPLPRRVSFCDAFPGLWALALIMNTAVNQHRKFNLSFRTGILQCITLSLIGCR